MTDRNQIRPLAVIGVVRTGYTDRAETPVQSSLNRSAPGVVEIDQRFAPALGGLDGFDYCWLLSWLGTADQPGPEGVALRQVPFLLQRAGREVGILATRGPRRINPLGLSLVRIVEVGPAWIRFEGVDLVDGTPIVDVKPYVSAFDRPPGDGTVRCGWFDTVDLLEGSTPTKLKPDLV